MSCDFSSGFYWKISSSSSRFTSSYSGKEGYAIVLDVFEELANWLFLKDVAAPAAVYAWRPKPITEFEEILLCSEEFPMLILYEIDDISRFRDPKKLCSYAGLVPSTHASGGRVYHGRITKQGNKWLRWALIEAVYPAIRADAELYACHERIRLRNGANAAKVATARRLLTIVYRVLSQGRFYQRRRQDSPVALVTS